MKKLLTIIILMLLIMIALSGCSNPETNTSSEELEKITVVLDWSINTNHTGLYTAIDQGYFEAEGLDVTIQAPPQTGAASLVASGTAHFGISYQEEVTYARLENTPIKAIAAIIQNNTSGFASRADAGIVTPEDFEGKRYGGWGSPMEEAMLKALMGKYDADYSKLEILSIGDMDFFAATEQNVDFTWIYEGWDGVAAELKDIEINYIALKDEEPALNYYTPVIITNEDYIKNNPDTIKRFLKAVSKGYQYAIDNSAEAAAILRNYAPELDEELVSASQKYLANQYTADASRWGEMNEEVWESFAAWMLERELIEGEVATKEAFTNEFLPQ